MSAKERRNVLYFLYFFSIYFPLLTILNAEIPIYFLFEVLRSNFLLAFNDISLIKSHKSPSLLVFKSWIFESSMLKSTSLNCGLSVNIELLLLSKCEWVHIYICISIYMFLSLLCICTHNLTHRAGIYSVSALEWHSEGTRQCQGFSRVRKWPFAFSKWPQE